MKINFKIISALAALLMIGSGCSKNIDNSFFIPGPEGDAGSGSGTGTIVPDVIAANQVKVISFNVRTATVDKGTAHAWDKRKTAVVALLKKENPSLFGVQEAVKEQMDYLKSQLPEYSSIGVGRDDGVEKGEFMSIFYKTAEFRFEEGDTFWLSETPDTPSKGWGAQYFRTATWAIFTHVSTGNKIFYLNTHIDHQSELAKIESIKLICEEKLPELNPGGYPVVITGDFNHDAEDTEIFGPLQANMLNARKVSAQKDNFDTYNGWGKSSSQIDHIFISTGFNSLVYKTIRDRYEGVPYASDHYPVSSLLEFSAAKGSVYASAAYDVKAGTRVSFVEDPALNDLRVSWDAEGEAFTVMEGTESSDVITFRQESVSVDGRTARFKAENYTLRQGMTYYAIYPWVDNFVMPDDIRMDLKVQNAANYASNADKAFMYASALCEDVNEPLNFNFHHATAVMKLKIALPADVAGDQVDKVILSADGGLWNYASISLLGEKPQLRDTYSTKGDILLEGPFEINGQSGAKSITLYFHLFESEVQNLKARMLIGDKCYVAEILGYGNILSGNWYYTTEAKEMTDELMLKVMSYNIRTSTADDGLGDYFTSNKHWLKRREAVATVIRNESPVVFGVQEAVKEQVDYLDGQLSGYASYGLGRDDGADAGEMMSVFYRTADLTLGEHGTFWLSETPDIPSKGWGANYYRTATWAVFTHIADGRKFFYLNTHLGHETALARTNSVTLICNKLKELNPKDYPVVITGDFNALISDAVLTPLKKVTSNTRLCSTISDDQNTYNNYGEGSARIIDHTFISSGFKSLKYRVVTDAVGSITYPSDHYPISSYLLFQ